MNAWLHGHRTTECLICMSADHHTSQLIKSYNRAGHLGIFTFGIFYANPQHVKGQPRHTLTIYYD